MPTSKTTASVNLKAKEKISLMQKKVPGLNDELSFMMAFNEKKNKSTLFTKSLEFKSYTSDLEDGTKMLALPGTIRIFIGKSSSPLLKQLRKSIESEDPTLQAEAMAAISKVMTSRKLTNRKAAQKMILEAKSIFDFKCGAKTIIDGAILPYNDDITYLDIPYCGTPFPKRFPPIPPIELDEWCGTGPNPKPQLDGVVVIHEPRLSKAEIGALKKIPASDRNMLIGGSTVAIGTSVWYVSAVALVAVVVMTVTAGCVKPSFLRDIHLEDNLIDNLGPMRTASELIALREQAMRGKL